MATTTDSDKAQSIVNLKPILFLEINLGEGKIEKISVYENTSPHDLAEEFAKKHSNLTNLIFILFFYLDFGTNLLEKLKQRFSFEIQKKKKQLSCI